MSDDIIPAQFDFKLVVEPDHDRWNLDLHTDMTDPTLVRLVGALQAMYVLHLECRRTFYRRAFTFHSPGATFVIPGPEMYGAVEASLLIVAAKDIDRYHHPGQHGDYGGKTFSIAAGEPLAVAASQEFEAFNEPDCLRQVSSILNIRKGADGLRHMQINCEDERILIILPPKDYVGYCQLRGGGTMTGVLVNSVVLPALLQSFHYLRSLDPTALSEFKADHRWARLVFPRLEALGVSLLNGDADVSACLTAAQELLRGPLSRSIENLTNLFDQPD